MITKKSLAWIYALLTLTLVAPVVWGLTDRLVDGGFESGTVGIDSWDQTLTIAPVVAALTNSPTRSGSGAMQYTNINPGTGSPVSYSGYRQHSCMALFDPAPAPERTHITFSGYVYVPDTATNFQSVRARVRFYQFNEPLVLV